MNSKKTKHLTLLGLVSLLTMAGTGSIVYFTEDRIQKNNTTDNDYDVPSIDDNTDVTETNFSKAINALAASKEITSTQVAVGLTPYNQSAMDPITLNLKNLDVDMANISASEINLATDLNVKYRGLDQTLNLRVEELQYAFVQYGGKAMRLFAPQTLSDVMEMLKAVGIIVPNEASSTSDVKISDILSQVKNYTNLIIATESTDESGNYVFEIKLKDNQPLVINNIRISNIDIKLVTDKAFSRFTVSTVNSDGIVIEEADTTTSTSSDTTTASSDSTATTDTTTKYTKKLALTLNGTLNAQGTSAYKKLNDDKAKYTDITDASGSIFETVTKVFNAKKANVGIDVALAKVDSSDNTKTTPWYDIDGTMYADCTGIAKDFSKGKYGLLLNHMDPNATRTVVAEDGTSREETYSEELNSLMAYYDGSASTTYLRFNNLVKGKISNSSVSDLMTYITQGTGKQAIAVISNELSTTLGNVDFDKVKAGDYSSLNGIPVSLDYDQSKTSFVLKADASCFGLTGGPISIAIKVDTSASNSRITKLSVSGLQYSGVDFTITLTPTYSDDTGYEEISTFATSQNLSEGYSDYKGVVPLFETLGNFVANREFLANYTLTYKDRIGKSKTDTSTYSTITASGQIGADLSSLGETKLKDGYQNGEYYLSFHEATSTSALSRDMEMFYKGTTDSHNLYLSYGRTKKASDSTSSTDYIFRNYIQQAQLGEMKTLLDSKTSSTVSASFDNLDEILSTLQASEDFKNCVNKLKKLDFTGLEDFVTISAADSEDSSHDTISVVLNINKFFADDALLANKIDNITLTLNSDKVNDNLQFTNIKVSTAISSDQTMDFTLSFEDYTSDKLSNYDTSNFTLIADANEIFSAFYHLGTDLKKYAITVNGEYQGEAKDDGSEGAKVSLKGEGAWDLTSNDAPVVGGYLTLSHPYVSFTGVTMSDTTVDQTIHFKYQNEFDANGKAINGQFTADYNKMHILMHSSSVSDIASTISTTSKTNVLLQLLSGGQEVSSSLPIVEAIHQHAPSMLLDYPLIDKVTFDDANNQIVIVADKALFGITDEGNVVTMTVKYTPSSSTSTDSDGNAATTTTPAKIDSLSMDLGTFKGVSVAKASIGFAAYDDTIAKQAGMLAYKDDTKAQFISLDSLPQLVKMGVDTTENNYFHLSGALTLDLSLFAGNASWQEIGLDSYAIRVYTDAQFYIKDNQVYSYLSFNLGDKDISEAGYYSSEFFIDPTKDSVYVNVVTNTDGSTKKAKAYKATTDNIKNNLPYYALSVVLDLDDRPAGKTIAANVYDALAKKSSSSTTNTTDDTSSSATTDTDSDTTTTTSSLTDGLEINLSSDFSSLIESTALYDSAHQKFSFVGALNQFFSVTYQNSDSHSQEPVFSFGATELDLYHQTQKNVASGEKAKTPFYALTAKTSVSVLGGIAKVAIHADFRMNGNDGDFGYFDSVDSLKTSKASNANQAMYHYFDFMTKFDALTKNNSDGTTSAYGTYSIHSFTMKTKTFYDFSSYSLKDFATDYEVFDNGKYYTATDTDAAADDWLFTSTYVEMKRL